jgi:hypothetical protein
MLAISWPPVRKQQAGSVLDTALLRRMLSDAAVLRSAALDVAKIGSDRFGGLICELRDGLVLQFGDDRDLAQKASLVEPILHAYRGRREQPASIDLRAPGTPVVQLRRPKK